MQPGMAARAVEEVASLGVVVESLEASHREAERTLGDALLAPALADRAPPRDRRSGRHHPTRRAPGPCDEGLAAWSERRQMDRARRTSGESLNNPLLVRVAVRCNPKELRQNHRCRGRPAPSVPAKVVRQEQACRVAISRKSQSAARPREITRLATLRIV